MLEHSSNNSSNLFALSSQSSRSDLKKSKKHSYSSFVKKVKGLLEVEGDDLDELYRKVEIIVKKYFDQHQIVEFGEMYDHLVALKSNSKKMGKLVTLLEKKLIQEQTNKQKGFLHKHSDRSEDVEVTNSTRKEKLSKNEKLENQKGGKSPIKAADCIQQNEESVISSIKYQYSLQPLSNDSKVRQQRKTKMNRKEMETSPSKYSPSKLNSSFQEYQSRNKKYEDKVKKLMEELNDIKYSLNNQSNQPEEESFYMNPHLKDDLKIKLDLSDSIKEESHSEEVIASLPTKKQERSESKEKSKMNQTKQSDSLSINKESFSIQIKPEISIDKEKSNASSLRTIGDQTSIREQHQTSKKKRESETRAVQERKSVLLAQANSITKQLQELRSVASMLQIDSQQKINYSNKPKSEHEAFSSETRILELTKSENKQQIQSFKKEKSNQQSNSLVQGQKVSQFPEQPQEMVLDKISNTSSKMEITEENIPSFKKVQGKPTRLQTSINVFEASSKIPEDSSIFSFSNTRFNPQMIQSGHPSYVQIPSRHNSHPQSYPQYQAIQNNSYSYNQRPFNLEVSTVKQGYYPYPQQQYEIRDQVSHPQIRFVERQPKRSVSISNKNISLASPKQSHQFSVALSKSDFPVEKNSGIRIASKQKLSTQKNRYSHLKHGENQRNFSVPKVRFVSPSYSQENTKKTSFNHSSSSFKRKGLNMMLSPSMR